MNYLTIIEQIQNKDSRCLEVLYKTYGSRFYDYCIRKWLLTEDAAWEVVYKTLETIVAKAGTYSFQSEMHFHNFLFKVHINFLRQQYRKKQKSGQELEFVDLNDEGTLNLIQRKMDKKAFDQYYESETTTEPEMMQNFKEALAQLPPGDKDLLLLKAQNYTYEEIAEILGIENNQLKVKHYRAKQKLITILNKSVYE